MTQAAARNHILDAGLGLTSFIDYVETHGTHISLVKLGWGTALLDPPLAARKVAICHAHEISCSPGGTLLEYFLSRRLPPDDFVNFVQGVGFDTVEVSDGTIAISQQERTQLVKHLRNYFTVVTEVGSKDASFVMAPYKWVRQILSDLEDGATHVILEGRESGTAGLYRDTGEVRHGLIEEVLDAPINPEQLVFEAPKKEQQVEIIKVVGPQANLGNIHLADVLGVQTLRYGLRSDTMKNVPVLDLPRRISRDK